MLQERFFKTRLIVIRLCRGAMDKSNIENIVQREIVVPKVRGVLVVLTYLHVDMLE